MNVRIGIGKLSFNVSRGATLSHDSQAQLLNVVNYMVADGKPSVDEAAVNRGWWFAANRQVWGHGARVPLNLYVVRAARRGGRSLAAAYRLTEPFRSRISFMRDGQEWVPVSRHPFLRLLAEPNADESGMEFHARQLLSMQDAGRCFVAVYPEAESVFTHPDLPGVKLRPPPRIKEMRILEYNRVRVERGSDRAFGRCFYSSPYGGLEEFRSAPANSRERDEWRKNPYPFAYRVVHPSSVTYEGASPAKAATTAIATADALGTLHWNQVKNGIHAGLIFLLKAAAGPNLDTERFRKAVLLVRAGIGKAGQPMVLDHNVEVQKNPLSNNEMGFKDLAEASRQMQLATQGVSDGIVGLGANINRSTLWAMMQQFATGTIDPLNSQISSAYNRWILPLYPAQSDGTWFECAYDSARMVDEKDQADLLLKLTGGKPIIMQNEAREILGYAPVANGNELDNSPATPDPAAVAGEAAKTALQQQEDEADRGLVFDDSGALTPCGCKGERGKA